jgi:septum site-determining protein MinC
LPERVTIKGTKEGLLVIIGPGDLPFILQLLDEHIAQKPTFFRGGRVALKVGHRHMTCDEIGQVGACLQRWQMTLWAVESDSAETAASARTLGLEAGTHAVASLMGEPSPRETISGDESGEATIMHRTLRSGQSIRHTGHIILIGDVNPGAEVVAGGSVVVWGKLRGIVHAGAWGDRTAIICALRLLPTQLRIADAFARSPDEGYDLPNGPELAALVDGEILIEPWR